MTTNIHELFNDTLPQLLKDHPDKVKEIKGKFQVNITGESGGEWFLDPVSDPPTCTPGVGKADATLSMTDAKFQELAASKSKAATVLKMVLWGHLKVNGNIALVKSSGAKLAELFGSK